MMVLLIGATLLSLAPITYRGLRRGPELTAIVSLVGVILTTGVGIMWAASEAEAVTPIDHPIAKYEMNEGPRQDVLHDATRHNLNGVIGRKIDTNGRFLHFDKVSQSVGLQPGRTARVDSNRFNPGTGDFTIQWRARTDKKMLSANVMAKGQGSPAGGMFKIKNSMRDDEWLRASCFWRGPYGQAFTETTPGMDIRGGWHVYRCTRIEGVGVQMFIDGQLVDSDTDPGYIANDWPLSIGGNHVACGDIGDDHRHCNYWAGDLDWIRFYR